MALKIIEIYEPNGIKKKFINLRDYKKAVKSLKKEINGVFKKWL